MSSRNRLSPTSEVRAQVPCMCSAGGACTAFAPGHSVHLIQSRLAAATPSEWIDATVELADETSGVVTLRTLDDVRIEVWNAGGAASTLAAGSPVALHGRYHLLAVGLRRFNVAQLTPVQAGD